MDIVTLLSTDNIACETESSSKKCALEHLAAMLAENGSNSAYTYEAIFDALIAREKLGSTVLGNGIAIPHACLEVAYPKAALLLLEEGLKMDAPDKKPVGVILALIVPKGSGESHSLLSEFAALLNHKSTYGKLLELRDPQLIQDYLHHLFNQGMAA
ncbi:MAG: PTS sugar transporter subunit IIA [Proteobacteria bacterium]|nr:MAG: PTS sugar transporter subunit IIA [Pseudomonadota bacterium]